MSHIAITIANLLTKLQCDNGGEPVAALHVPPNIYAKIVTDVMAIMYRSIPGGILTIIGVPIVPDPIRCSTAPPTGKFAELCAAATLAEQDVSVFPGPNGEVAAAYWVVPSSVNGSGINWNAPFTAPLGTYIGSWTDASAWCFDGPLASICLREGKQLIEWMQYARADYGLEWRRVPLPDPNISQWAAAQASVSSNGTITGIAISNTGSGYRNAPNVSFTARALRGKITL